MKNTVYPNPFGYNEIEQKQCKTFYEQREASYKKPQKPIYQGNSNLAFTQNYQGVYPQLAVIDGYKAEDEIKKTIKK